MQRTVLKLIEVFALNHISLRCQMFQSPSLLIGLVYRFASKQQHDFVKYRSTNTQLITHSKFLLLLRVAVQLDPVYTDLSKALDWVNLSLLVGNLKLLGFSISKLKWRKRYLSKNNSMLKIGRDIVHRLFSFYQASHRDQTAVCYYSILL